MLPPICPAAVLFLHRRLSVTMVLMVMVMMLSSCGILVEELSENAVKNIDEKSLCNTGMEWNDIDRNSTSATSTESDDEETIEDEEDDDESIVEEKAIESDSDDGIAEERFFEGNETENIEEFIFKEAKLTKEDVMAMIYGIALKHHWTKAARSDLVELIQIFANINTMDATNYFFTKNFDKVGESVKYIHYCECCKSLLEEQTKQSNISSPAEIECPNRSCKTVNKISAKSNNYFAIFDTREQICSILKKNLKNACLNKNLRDDCNSVKDVQDGELYQHLRRSGAKFDLTYNFSTDGAPIFHSSRCSMWPIQMTINELAPKDRFRNLIFAGIWVGKGEPDVHLMNSFMSAFVTEANSLLENGVEIEKATGETVNLKLMPLICSVDSVARPVLQNRLQFNGRFGCSWCYHPGSVVGRTIKYPQPTTDPPNRSLHSHMLDLEEVRKRKYTAYERGVKGPASLINLPHFDMVWSFAADYMHGILLGRRTRNTETNGISVLGEFNHEAFPRFAEPIPNVTVTVGRDALLACVVDNLRAFKVAWVRVDTQTILSIHHNVITQNPRISLSYNDHRSWFLHIRNVQEADRGWYMCQVNTDPMRSRQGYLQVVVPPSIIDKETSSDMVVLESTNVSLTCKATGYPEPYVMWRREDGEDIRYNGENVNVVDGEILFITKVSRLHMAAYLCIASNGVPPSISKRVQLKVQFPPMLSIPNQLEGAYIGQDVTLECRTEAFPTSINYWTTERGDMIISGDKYESVSMDSDYKKYMMLKIRRVNKDDFGSYKCVAKNSLGETDGVIKLEEIPAPTTITTTTQLPSNPPKKKGRARGGGGPHGNRVDSVVAPAAGAGFDDAGNAEYDYDGEYTLPSNGPPPIQEPPGAYSRGARSRTASAAPSSFVLLLLVLLGAAWTIGGRSLYATR